MLKSGGTRSLLSAWVNAALSLDTTNLTAEDFGCSVQARAFAEGLNRELKSIGATGVHVTCICPTHINTKLFKGFDNPGSFVDFLEWRVQVQGSWNNKFVSWTRSDNIQIPFATGTTLKTEDVAAVRLRQC